MGRLWTPGIDTEPLLRSLPKCLFTVAPRVEAAMGRPRKVAFANVDGTFCLATIPDVPVQRAEY